MITSRWRQSFNKNHFEKEAWLEKAYICGLDEVGRGCLAGPVVTAAVILKQKTSPLLKDSKLLSPEERLRAYNWIKKNSWFSVALIHHRLIDQHNIYQATLLGMKRAFMQVMAITPHRPQLALIDAMPLNLMQTPFENIDVLHFPFGEKKSSSIAAASIIAKVTRDLLMERMNKAIPQYVLNQHKGYATPLHKQLIIQQGCSIIHRKSFLTNIPSSLPTASDKDHQQSIL